jgi:hypothetical protein
MKYRHSFLPSIRGALAAASLLATASAGLAAPVAFKSNFTTDTIHAETPVISQTGTNWYVMGSRSASGYSVGSGFFYLPLAVTSSAVAQATARFSPVAHDLTEVGDFIEADVTFYTFNIRSVAFGFYNSYGSNPYTTLENSGIDQALTTAIEGGTKEWRGLRILIQGPAADATGFGTNIRNRAAQTGTNNRVQELLAATGGSADYNTPGPVNLSNLQTTGSTFSFADYGEYRLRLTVTRSASDAFTVSYSLYDSVGSLLYSASAVSSAAGTRPSDLTSAFDSFAFGFRNFANATSNIDVMSLTITSQNSQIARVATQPSSQSLVPGQNGSLSVIAGGVGPFTYQWFKDGAPIFGAVGATYSIPSASGADVGTYYATVSNALGTDRSENVTVSVSSASAPSFTLQPTAKTVNAGDTLTLVTEVSGAPTPSIQWYRNTEQIGGATSTTYVKENAASSDAGTYYAVATNSQGSATSNSVLVTVVTAGPVITQQPAPVAVNLGQTIQLTVTATGLPAPSYQWYRNEALVPGATLATYIVENATVNDAGDYYVRVYNTEGTVNSATVAVTVTVLPPVITVQPGDQVVGIGQTAAFSVTATGSAPLSYQWYRGNGTLVPGANARILTFASASVADSGTYYCVVTNTAGTATSNTATLTVSNLVSTTVYESTMGTDTKHAEVKTVTPTSTSWYVMSSSGRTATVSSVGDDPATPEVEARPLTLTYSNASSSAYVEAAAFFAANPVEIANSGESLKLTALVTTNNVVTLGFGLFNSAGSRPHIGMDVGKVVNTQTDFKDGGTRPWKGYRAHITSNSTAVNTSYRPPQVIEDNRSQELLLPGVSGGFSYPLNVSLTGSTLPASPSAVTWADGQQYTLQFTINRTTADQYTISVAVYHGAQATGTPLYSSVATTTAADAIPSATTNSFDALGFAIRNRDSAVPSLVVQGITVERSVPGEPEGSAFSTFVSGFGLNPLTNGAPDADPDGDGVVNALEFILGGNPTVADRDIMPTAELNGSTWTFSFYRRTAALADFAIVVETSGELTGWAAAVHGQNGVTIATAPVDAEGELVVVTMPATGSRMFARIRATPIP